MNYLKNTLIGQKINNIESTKSNHTKLAPENMFSQLLMSVINELPGFIYWKNKKGVYLWHNILKEEDRKKYQWPYSIAGKTDYDLFPHSIAELCKGHDLETMLSENEIIKKEISYSLTGKTYIQLSFKKALKDDQGKIIGIVGNLIDVSPIKNRKMQLVNNIYKNNFKRQIKTISDNLQIYIKEPLKEVLLLVNLLATNEDKNDNLVLISEIKNFIKTLFNDFDNILKCSFDITKQMTICKN